MAMTSFGVETTFVTFTSSAFKASQMAAAVLFGANQDLVTLKQALSPWYIPAVATCKLRTIGLQSLSLLVPFSAAVVGDCIICYGGGAHARNQTYIYRVTRPSMSTSSKDNTPLSVHISMLVPSVKGRTPGCLVASTGIAFRNYLITFGGFNTRRGGETGDFNVKFSILFASFLLKALWIRSQLLDLAFASSKERVVSRQAEISADVSLFLSQSRLESCCAHVPLYFGQNSWRFACSLHCMSYHDFVCLLI